jgi:beta-glucosidase
MADVIFGKSSPAGRLVQTWPSSIDQLLPILEYDIRKGRTYQYSKSEPLFPFGFGLSYTLFSYSDLRIEKKSAGDNDTVKVNFKLENKGDYDSDEVVQLYVSFPESKVERPAIALKGFSRVHVRNGEAQIITIPLKTDDLKYWDVDEHAFVLEKGKVNLYVGASSADLRLHTSVEVR